MEDGMENAGYTEILPEAPSDPPAEDVSDPPLEDAADPVPADQDDIGERIDDLLEQIGVEKTYGSMGDYYVAEAGCCAFPGEDVFFYFVGEAERADWTAASNGCYVPSGSLGAYEAYLASGIPEEKEDAEEAEAPPSVSQNDIAGIEDILGAMYEQDAAYHEASILYMQEMETALDETRSLLGTAGAVLMAISLFISLLCGGIFAHMFWNRMRAG